MSAALPLQTQVIGALPVIQAYFDKLDFADTIDRFVPWEGDVPPGTLTETLAANRPPTQEAATPGYRPPEPNYGRSKSGRKDLKQMQLGLDVLGDGAVPVGHTVLDGNTAEATTHQANLKRLKAVLPTSRFLLISDSKGDTEENLLRIKAEDCEFLW